MSEEEFSGVQKRLIGWILIAVLGGNAGAMLNLGTSKVRSDPFTGSQGRDLQKQLNKIDAIQQTMLHRMQEREREDRELSKLVREHLRRHPQ